MYSLSRLFSLKGDCLSGLWPQPSSSLSHQVSTSAQSLSARALLRRRSPLTYFGIVSHFSYTIGRRSLLRYYHTIPHFLRSMASTCSISLFVYSHNPYRGLFTSIVCSVASTCRIALFVYSHDPYRGLFTLVAH